MPEVDNPRHVLEPQLRKAALAAGATVAAIGGFFLFSWLSGRMTDLGFRAITMKTNASLCLLVSGLALILPTEILDRIFDPYFTTKPTDIGTGIGLFMSRTIIEKSMGGRLTVRNTDAGAEFRIEV